MRILAPWGVDPAGHRHRERGRHRLVDPFRDDGCGSGTVRPTTPSPVPGPGARREEHRPRRPHRAEGRTACRSVPPQDEPPLTLTIRNGRPPSGSMPRRKPTSSPWAETIIVGMGLGPRSAFPIVEARSR
jgi:hypothetical protein